MEKEKKKLLNIPTKAEPEVILDFWLRLQGKNEKGSPYWNNKDEIKHFVYQNFDGFPGVSEIKEFNPNMNKTDLYHVTWVFYKKYHVSKGKRQYAKLLVGNFTEFKNNAEEKVYPNIKDYLRNHLNSVIQ